MTAAAFLAVLVLVLLHGTPTVDHLTNRYDRDGESLGDAVTLEIRCIPVTSGTDGPVDREEGPLTVHETPNGLLGDSEFGLADGETNAFCDRARDARIAWAVQAGLGAVALMALGMALLRRRPPPR